jgi:glycogen debranching enzyme
MAADPAEPARVRAGLRRSPIPSVPVVTDLPSKVLTIKEGDTFLYSDLEGNLDADAGLGLGLYHRDTRFLSHFRMEVSGRDPVLLSSSAERAYLSHIDLTNPDLFQGDTLAVPQQTLNIRRVRIIEDRLYERIRIKNYNAFDVRIDVGLTFDADFADLFEIRGLHRETRGTYEEPTVDGRVLEFAYLGEDGVRRTTRVAFGLDPAEVEIREDAVEALFSLHIGGHETKSLSVMVEPSVDGRPGPSAPDFDAAVHRLRRSYEAWEAESTQIRTDNEVFNEVLLRGLRDLRALRTRVDDASVIAAGIPWYVAPFGRDTLITSHQLLMVNAAPARDSLRVLARYQATDLDDWRDAEPGKILHEIRTGELAGSGFIPHTPYYGTADATPWFLILFAQYFRWTNDTGFAKELLPSAEAALRWIDEYGDLDGDGFVEYRVRSPRGLLNQGWKDSEDGVVDEDGRRPPQPIALAEVQAYVYMAKMRMADVFEALDDRERAVRLRDQAATLRQHFNEAFWMEEEHFFAGALDAEKRQVRTIVSNPGHGLYCGIVDPDKGVHVGRRLLQPDLFSGWGIRTMSKSATPYNPMSYHDGTVWPHDNALIAAGLKRYGFVEATNRVASAMFDAATYARYMRLPELFCGFARRTPAPPVDYPVACSPQAWAAGAPFLLLQAMLGVSAVAHENLLTVNKPHLPPWLNRVELNNMQVGESRLSLEFRRDADTTSFSLTSKEGGVRVVMEE